MESPDLRPADSGAPPEPEPLQPFRKTGRFYNAVGRKALDTACRLVFPLVSVFALLVSAIFKN